MAKRKRKASDAKLLARLSPAALAMLRAVCPRCSKKKGGPRK